MYCRMLLVELKCKGLKEVSLSHFAQTGTLEIIRAKLISAYKQSQDGSLLRIYANLEPSPGTGWPDYFIHELRSVAFLFWNPHYDVIDLEQLIVSDHLTEYKEFVEDSVITALEHLESRR